MYICMFIFFVVLYLNIFYIFQFFFFLYHLNFFFFFFFFFFITSALSLIFFNFLGFLGVFFSNLFVLTFGWLSFFIYFEDFFINNYFCYFNFGKWLQLSTFYFVNLEFFFDVTSFSFAFLTLTIGLSAYIYAFSYFRYEPNVERLLVLLNFFMLSMIFLVCSSNFVNLFLGWELIGLSSFFLINFWTARINTLKSAFKAFSFNKVSDFFLLLAIILLYSKSYSLDINTFLTQIKNNDDFFFFFFLK